MPSGRPAGAGRYPRDADRDLREGRDAGRDPRRDRSGPSRPGGGRNEGRDDERSPRRVIAAKQNEPAIPTDVDTGLLHRAVRAELRSLPKELADIVAAHLVMAGQLVDSDPELAYGHAEAARRRAARLPIIREATAETAYASGHYDVALTEYRALRRMTGENSFLPVMADCERALGRPQAAVKLAREADSLSLDPQAWVEMRIVESGARHDQGQTAEAIRVLRDALTRLPPQPSRSKNGERLRLPTARVHYALADLLLAEYDEAGARQHFAIAAELDVDGEIDAQEQLDLLDGVEIDFDETDDEIDFDETDDETPAAAEDQDETTTDTEPETDTAPDTEPDTAPGIDRDPEDGP